MNDCWQKSMAFHLNMTTIKYSRLPKNVFWIFFFTFYTFISFIRPYLAAFIFYIVSLSCISKQVCCNLTSTLLCTCAFWPTISFCCSWWWCYSFLLFLLLSLPLPSPLLFISKLIGKISYSNLITCL